MKSTIKSDKWRKRIKWSLPFGFILIIAMVAGANYTVEQQTNHLVFNSISTIPTNHAGLLLGTSKTLKSGKPNQYFKNRILATVQLYNAGKINVIVISGDNSQKGYNEPEDMKSELIQAGIPESKIYLDFAGFRTLDSVIRMEKIFKQTHFTIISQEFHNRRAIYLAQAKNLNTVGFNAEDVNAYNGFKTQLREKLARVKLFIDLWTNKYPKFLGEPVLIQ